MTAPGSPTRPGNKKLAGLTAAIVAALAAGYILMPSSPSRQEWYCGWGYLSSGALNMDSLLVDTTTKRQIGPTYDRTTGDTIATRGLAVTSDSLRALGAPDSIPITSASAPCRVVHTDQTTNVAVAR